MPAEAIKFRIKHFDHDNVAANAPFSAKWDTDRRYLIKYILFKRKDGNPFTATDVTVYMAKQPITLDHALASTFGRDPQTAFPINQTLEPEETFEYNGVNREGATISFVVELIMEAL